MTAAMGDASRGKRQRLADVLRRQRDRAGLTGRELARQIGISQSKVSRVESGVTLPSLPEVVAWAEAVGASAETRELLTALTEGAHMEVGTWDDALQDRPHLQDVVHARETEASRTLSFQPLIVHGLLQTAAYARSVFTMVQKRLPQHDVSTAVASRMNRQPVLYDDGKRFEFLMAEGALRWRPGSPRLLMAQLDRIATVSSLDNVSIGIIPFDLRATTTMPVGFTLYEHDDEETAPYVTIETPYTNLTVNSPEGVAAYLDHWAALRQMARFGDEARAFLAELSAELQTIDD